MAERDPIKTLDVVIKNLDKMVASILNDCAFKIKSRVDSQEFIHWKSRRKPIVVEKAKVVGNLLVATVRGASHWTWGEVLIGPAGSTTIRPKAGMLAIPTDFARKGVKSPRRYGGQLKIFAGIMWGVAGWSGAGTGGGLRQHRAAGEKFKKSDLVPMFILKGSVVVRRRVIPAELIVWIQPYFKEQLAQKALVIQ